MDRMWLLMDFITSFLLMVAFGVGGVARALMAVTIWGKVVLTICCNDLSCVV